jgi:hypothetical protein
MLSIPRCLLEWNIPSRMEALPKQRDQAGESKEARGHPLGREVRPLSLCLHTQIGPALFKGDFSTPALHKIGADGKARLGLISREIGPWLMLPLGITGQDPSDG